jgi:hypothetical protein
MIQPNLTNRGKSMKKIQHKGVRTTVKTIVDYKADWMDVGTALHRLEGVRDVVMNSVEMEMIDLYVICRLIQAWTSQRYRPLREEIDVLEQAGIFQSGGDEE